MEILDSVWQISIIALVAGVMIGVLAYRLIGPSAKQADKIKTELEEARDELNSYKAEVNQHFNKTSELVNDLTQNYVKVYQHLAEGSQTLGDSKNFNNLLEQHKGRVSIAVADDTPEREKMADDLLVDPAETQATAEGATDEHLEPSETPGDSAAAVETTPEVDALVETTDNARAETQGETAETAPEDADKPKG